MVYGVQALRLCQGLVPLDFLSLTRQLAHDLLPLRLSLRIRISRGSENVAQDVLQETAR